MAVRWYLRFSLSYHAVEELLAERGLHADYVTVWRWSKPYAPELQRYLRRHLKPTNDSWRVDETYVRVNCKWCYPHGAVDSTGATLDFLLSAKQDAAAAKRFLAKALGGANSSLAAGDQHRRPRRVSARRRAAQSRRRSRRGLQASAGAIFEQRARAGPPRH